MNPQNEISIDESEDDFSLENELKKNLKLLNGETIEFKSKNIQLLEKLGEAKSRSCSPIYIDD